MGLIEFHLHDPEFNFAPFSSQGSPADTTADSSDEAADDDLYFPNDETETGRLSGILVFIVFVVAAAVVRKLVKGSDDLDDFGEDDEA